MSSHARFEHHLEAQSDEASASTDRLPVSIVCVYNDSRVLEACLERSIEAGRRSAPETEFIKVDNRTGAFKTAAAALNSGAKQAQNRVVVFVHQDVILHSLPALERAAAIVCSQPIGLVGAVGMNRHRRVLGQIRDRVVRIGAIVPEPRDVQVVDEVLFMVPRELILREPLREEAALAWHAYAAEYALRLRRAGLRVVAVDIPLTHNSLTTNLERLDVAHEWLGAAYPEMLPIITTCGIIPRSGTPPILNRLARRARSARTWWQESLVASRIMGGTTEQTVVLADIRLLIDDAAQLGGFTEIRVLDIHRDGIAAMPVDGIERLGRRLSAVTLPLTELDAEIAGRADSELLLITNITPDSFSSLHSLRDTPHVTGFWLDAGLWVLVGASHSDLSALWTTIRSRPYAGLLGGD